jgi:hypothetical protein
MFGAGTMTLSHKEAQKAQREFSRSGTTAQRKP